MPTPPSPGPCPSCASAPAGAPGSGPDAGPGAQPLTSEERSRHHILLVCPTYCEQHAPGAAAYPPVGITLIASILQRAGYRVHLVNGALDADYLRKFEELLASTDLLYVGFSVMTSQVKAAVELSLRVKQVRPDTPVVWGGFHPTIYPDQTIVHEAIDYLMAGESAETIVSLSDFFARGETPKGLAGLCTMTDGVIRKEPIVNNTRFEHLPDIDWTFLDERNLERVITNFKMLGSEKRCLPLLSGLGCTYKCSFCINTLFKNAYRAMPATQIHQSIKELIRKHGVTHIIFYDEYFFGSKKRLYEFLELLEKEPLGVSFYASMRSSDYTRLGMAHSDILGRLAACGFKTLGVGAESGSQRVLDKLNKKITVQETLHLAKACQQQGIACFFSFIVGIPTETEAEVLDTFHLIDAIYRLGPIHRVIGPQIFRPYPGSSLFQEAVAGGLVEPATLKEWTDTELLSTFKLVTPSGLPWVPFAERLKYLMASFNIQSRECDRTYLPVLAREHFQRKAWYARLPLALRRGLDRLIGLATTRLVELQTWRIRHKCYAFFVEKYLVAWLERRYFAP